MVAAQEVTVWPTRSDAALPYVFQPDLGGAQVGDNLVRSALRPVGDLRTSLLRPSGITSEFLSS